MTETENHTIRYFKAPKDYFWHWADSGTVIEWQNGKTICYRDDLVFMLQQLSNKGVPPLSTLLLLLSACRQPLGTAEMYFLYKNFIDDNNKDNEAENYDLKTVLDDAINFLKIVADLPEYLRAGKRRVHLIHEVFETGDFTVTNSQLQDALEEINSGRLDKDVFHYFSESVTREEFLNHLQYLGKAYKKFPTVQQLVVKLRTGIDQLPEALDIEMPEATALNIIDQLLQDPKTAGVARLSRLLITALNMPIQLKGSSELPLGGISDITNRGNYDKLLLSELAYDDELLMARLVNNEALYFRREQPPEQQKTQRIILMDITLRMWGTSRVFALAAGLASAQHSKHAELLQAYSLGGISYTAVNINVKAGIIQALEMLDHALHCGKSLEAVIQSIPANKQNEIIFITDARLLHSPTFHVSLTAVKALLSFVITVSNNGEMNLYRYTNGISKHIRSAKFDVDELLSVSSGRTKKAKSDNVQIPQFLTCNPAPLYFASSRVKIIPEKAFVKKRIGVVAINETQRVLFVNQEGKGMIEVLNYIEKGVYTFGISNNDSSLTILISNHQQNVLKLYKINITSFTTSCLDLSGEVPFFMKAAFTEEYLYMQTYDGVYVYDCVAEIVIAKKEYRACKDILDQPRLTSPELMNLIRASNFNIAYESIFYRVKGMYINNKRQLVVGKHVVTVSNKIHISFNEHLSAGYSERDAKLSDNTQFLVQNRNVSFNVWIWKDGSEAIVDSRGLLHLKSADRTIPEITIVMVLNRTSACWASDGTAAGASFFINEKITRVINAEDFYNLYIQKYIDHLI